MSRHSKSNIASINIISKVSDLVFEVNQSCYGYSFSKCLDCLKGLLDCGVIDSRQFSELSIMLANYFDQESKKHYFVAPEAEHR